MEKITAKISLWIWNPSLFDIIQHVFQILKISKGQVKKKNIERVVVPFFHVSGFNLATF